MGSTEFMMFSRVGVLISVSNVRALKSLVVIETIGAILFGAGSTTLRSLLKIVYLLPKSVSGLVLFFLASFMLYFKKNYSTFSFNFLPWGDNIGYLRARVRTAATSIAIVSYLWTLVYCSLNFLTRSIDGIYSFLSQTCWLEPCLWWTFWESIESLSSKASSFNLLWSGSSENASLLANRGLYFLCFGSSKLAHRFSSFKCLIFSNDSTPKTVSG